MTKFVPLSVNVDSGGKFRIFGWPRASACFRMKARLMPVTSWQEDKQTEKTAVELPENEENLKGLGLRNHCYVQQKEDQLFVTKKNNEQVSLSLKCGSYQKNAIKINNYFSVDMF